MTHTHTLIHSIWSKICHRNERNLILCLFIKGPMKLTVAIADARIHGNSKTRLNYE